MKNFSYALTSNAISIIISIIVVLFIPKFIGVINYGYWQLYILYSSFVGFMHFGWIDGLYLKLGGLEYDEIDKDIITTQFYFLLISQLIAALIFICTTIYLSPTEDKQLILIMTAVCMVIVNLKQMLLFLLQATYRIKTFSFITIFDRVFYLTLIVILLFCKVESYRVLIFVDLIAKLMSLLLASYYCKDIVFNFFVPEIYSGVFNEIIDNIKSGLKLMLSNITSILIIGNIRLAIENVWSIIIFGKISLILNMTGFFMVFINSISLVLFPFLRKVDSSKLRTIYTPLRDMLTLVLMLLLLIYYPLSAILKRWLPDYIDALIYLPILFPIIVFEGRSSLLINTYLKVLRKENLLLNINLLTLMLSMLTTFLSVYILKNIHIAVSSILMISAFKLILAEYSIQRILDIKIQSNFFMELIIVLSFVSTGLFLNSLYGFLTYCLITVLSIMSQKKRLVNSFHFFASIMSR